MKVLLTGAFGNVGLSTLKELIKRNHDVRVYDIRTKRNKRLANRFKKDIEVIWGDLRNYKEAQNSPCAFGTFCILYNGKAIAYHPISNTRFTNIMNKILK